MHDDTLATRLIEVIAKRLIGSRKVFVPMRLEMDVTYSRIEDRGRGEVPVC